ncbi:amino acid transport system permease protein [Brachyspira intermedia PWS/A]|uniref:Putative glutamine transport system permease protein GlnP n=1 Tax=Brachyspira intermedia (strain ATCC 51140 / PWS/A) TaxID=1045858 RepID=G0EHV2_BRAIP|nr:amino acid ABC transporter permease [Brachyspira intermedia]AEM20915.1 amino acid transport system permease protein [Brachyspira intermedia PWS/A]
MLEYLELLKLIFISNERYIYIIKGLLFSVGTTACSTIIGVILGILVALLQLSEFYPFKNSAKLKDFNPLSKLAFWYVNILRGTPVVVQLMIWANVIFVDSLRDTPILIIAAIAFGINSGAYVAEIIRAGIQSLDKGQMEAARALGMNYSMSMKEIIIPQAIKKILPPLVSEFIALLKETSVVGFIGGVDLLRSANIITSQTYRGVEPLIAVGIIYFILTSVFAMIMKRVEEGLRESD